MILKELKQTDGDFSEDQRIELNTVRRSNLSVAARALQASFTFLVCLCLTIRFFKIPSMKIEENLLIFH